MRLFKSAITLIVVLGLLAGSATTTAAQDIDSKAPAAVLGWVLDETHVADGNAEEVDGTLQRRGPSYSPRLAGR